MRTNGRVKMTAAMLLALAGIGCDDQTGVAQEAAVVPDSQRLVLQLADRARVKGDTAAPIRMLELSDFQCPFCRQYFEETFPAIDSLYVETGKVQYVWVSFANPGHMRAWPAIEAAFCAGAAGEFWPMHDLLFENQSEWSEAENPNARFREYAAEIGIEAESFAACLRNDDPAPLQVRDYQSALAAGISSTPFFVVGDSVALRGALPLDAFTSTIDSVLAVRTGGGEEAASDTADATGDAPAGERAASDTSAVEGGASEATDETADAANDAAAGAGSG